MKSAANRQSTTFVRKGRVVARKKFPVTVVRDRHRTETGQFASAPPAPTADQLLLKGKTKSPRLLPEGYDALTLIGVASSHEVIAR